MSGFSDRNRTSSTRSRKMTQGVLTLEGPCMFSALRSLFSPAAREAELNQHLEQMRQRLPVPVLWLIGKTQTGKSSIVRTLTGAADAEIGQGFRPCTRHSRRYQFP